MKKLAANLTADSATGIPWLSRFMIGPRLAACFLTIVIVMLAGNALLMWQFHQVSAEAQRLANVDQELIAVLRFQVSLRSFYTGLNELAQSEDKGRFLAGSDTLQKALVDDVNRTEVLFRSLPPRSSLRSEVLSAVASVQSSLPSELTAARALAGSGDWLALRLRLARQVRSVELLSSELVRDVDEDVTTERVDATVGITRAQNRMILIFLITGMCTFAIASTLGVGITRSITEPLNRLEVASQALAQGDLQFRVATRGKDELSRLGVVFNDMAGRLEDLYEGQRITEAKLRDNEKQLQQLIEFAPLHVFVVRPDGTGLYANRVVLDYHGATLEEWMEDEFSDRMMHSDDRKDYLAGLEKGFAGSAPFEIQARILRHDGEYRWFLSRYNPMHGERGSILRWYVARTDIEETKQETQRAQNENLALREEVNRTSAFEEILGSSEGIRKVLVEIARVAPSDSTVLILGETGTGKELVARAIHKQSKRALRAFVRVNCAAIPSSLISSELFGHEKGAFTGAVQRRLGRFEAANGGTIFLDEIGDLPAETQVALLRVLQEREFERVGSNQPIPIDVRILAATNRNLRADVAAGTFRQDLFYRLNVFPIQSPPLRERREDIALLVEYFIERYAAKTGKRIRNIKRSTLEIFQSYGWPGNIRELQNVVERAVLLCDGDTLSVDATWFKQETSAETPHSSVVLRGLGRLEPSSERELIETALSESGGRISGPSGAAAKLGIPRQTLESKMARLGIVKRN